MPIPATGRRDRLQEAVRERGTLILQAWTRVCASPSASCGLACALSSPGLTGMALGLSPEAFSAAQVERPPQPWLRCGLRARTLAFMMVISSSSGRAGTTKPPRLPGRVR